MALEQQSQGLDAGMLQVARVALVPALNEGNWACIPSQGLKVDTSCREYDLRRRTGLARALAGAT